MPGRLALVLHAHLPYVRHPEHAQFYEETWLFEAVAECYLPLLAVLDGWSRDAVPWRLTLTLTPTLCAMLADPLLQHRCERYLAERVALAAKETERHLLQPESLAVAEFYLTRYTTLTAHWRALKGELLAAFRAHQEAGNLEILTCAATHALLPLWLEEPAALRAQLAVAVADYRRHFGRGPTSLWLPECAWDAGLEPFLVTAGLRRFVLETQGVLHAVPRPRCATFAPVLTPAGLAGFGRDPGSARQVWSRHGGYPGDPRYREFHQDLAHEAEWDYVRPHLPGVEQRVFTGLKYQRVTGGDGPKQIYDRPAAVAAAAEHARHFVEERARTLAAAAELLAPRTPLLVAPFDAELFGHWWFEGPEFLDAVVRRVAAGQAGFRLVTLGDWMQEFPAQQEAMPARSSWGEGGHLGVWLDESNAWMLGPLRAATRSLIALVRAWQRRSVDALSERALNQAGRELLLAQASDWPFLLKMATAGDYPARRFRAHLENVRQLTALLEAGKRDELAEVVAALEFRHPLFAELDWRLWGEGPVAAAL
jgi:1,4-alpha-glucan branching enzyme